MPRYMIRTGYAYYWDGKDRFGGEVVTIPEEEYKKVHQIFETATYTEKVLASREVKKETPVPEPAPVPVPEPAPSVVEEAEQVKQEETPVVEPEPEQTKQEEVVEEVKEVKKPKVPKKASKRSRQG